MTLIFAILIGLVFGLWGMLGSKVGGGAWTAPIVMTLTAVSAFWFGRRNLQNIPNASAFLWLAVAGVLNGWACCKFAELIASLGVKGGLFGALVSVCIAAAAVFWGYAFFRYFPNLQQTAGIVLGAVAIWLLTAK